MKFNDTWSSYVEMQKGIQQIANSLDSTYSFYNKNIGGVMDSINKNGHLLDSAVSAISLSPFANSINNFNYNFGTALKAALRSDSISPFNIPISYTLKLREFQDYSRLINRFESVVKSYKLLGITQIEKTSLLATYDQINKLMSSFSSILSQETLKIDFTGIDQLDFASLSSQEFKQPTNYNSAELPMSINVTEPKKKLVDMTEEDLFHLMKKCINPKTLGFSIVAFISGLYSDYVHEAARVMIEISLAFCISLITGHYDTQVKAAIKERVMETNTVHDLRKVITRYVKYNPYGQLGFVRNDTYLRKGTTKNAPLITNVKITIKTPLTILARRGNWLKVSLDDGHAKGEEGWIQESTVIKYKRVK